MPSVSRPLVVPKESDLPRKSLVIQVRGRGSVEVNEKVPFYYKMYVLSRSPCCS